MNGGLLKSASAVAILAAAGLFGASPAKAADLGGDCCADLEERVAELEATTARKGNRRVSLTISGLVGHSVLWWNDGTQSDTYIGDAANNTSRFRFVGTAKISPEMTAGFLYEGAWTANSLGSANQLNGGDDLGTSGNCNQAVAGSAASAANGTANVVGGRLPGTNNNAGCPHLRDSTVWLRHAKLGMVKIGFGSTATDNLILIDLGAMGVSGTPDQALHVGGFILRGNNGLLSGVNSAATGSPGTIGATWAAAIRGHEAFDTARRNHVLYETPTLVGFTLQAAVAEDNFWDIALRYAGEFGGIRIAAGIGYSEDTEFNGVHQLFNQQGALCDFNCNVKVADVKGSGSILHVPTGLFVTGSAGNRELSGNQSVAGGVNSRYAGPDIRYWHIAAGISQNFFGIGKTVLFGEYGEHKGGLAQDAFLNARTQFNNCTVATVAANPNCDSTVTNWGIGLVQYVDAAAMELYATYKNYSLDTNGFTGQSLTLNRVNGGVHDMQIFMVGTKLSF